MRVEHSWFGGGQALAPTLQQITDSLVIIEDDVNKINAEVQKIKVSRPLNDTGRWVECEWWGTRGAPDQNRSATRSCST